MSLSRIVGAGSFFSMFVTPWGYASLAIFLAFSGGLFASSLHFGEGRFYSLQSLWTLSVALSLPLLAAMSTMPLFAAERSSGTMELLATVPVKERDLVLGKFIAGLGVVLIGLFASLACWLLLRRALPDKIPNVSTLWPATLVLGLQALTWTSIGTLMSLVARRPVWSACGTLLACLSFAWLWGGASRFFPEIRWHMPAYPLAIELLDAASGRLALVSLVRHASFTWFFLYVSVRLLEVRQWR